MDLTSQNQEKAQNMGFLFCIPVQNTASQCCCGCTLRVGVQILTALFLLGNIGVIIRAINFLGWIHYDTWSYILLIIITVFQMIAAMLLLISTCTNNFMTAFIGNIIYTVFILLGFVLSIASPFLATNDIYFTTAALIVYYIIFLPFYFVYIYYAFIIFSFVKELGLGNFAKIDGGAQVIVVTDGYQNYNNNSGVNISVTGGMTSSVPAYQAPMSNSSPAYQQPNTQPMTNSTQAYQGYQSPNQGNQGNQGYQGNR